MASRPVNRINKWENVQVHQDKKKLFSKCTLSFVSHFLSVRGQAKNVNPFFIFLPDFSPTTDESSSKKVMILSVSHTEIKYTFTFATHEQAELFTDAINRAVVHMQEIIATPESYNEHFTINVDGVIPECSTPKMYSITVDPVLSKIQVISPGSKVIDFEIRKTWCSCLTAQYKSFKKSAKTQWSFKMRRDNENDDYVFVANGEQEMMQLVMMVYIHSFRTVRTINRMKVAAKSTPEIHIVDVVEAPSEKSMNQNIPAPSADPTIKKGRLKIRRSVGDVRSLSVPMQEEASRPCFLKGKRKDVCRERYAQMCLASKTLYEPTPVEIPSINSFVINRKFESEITAAAVDEMLERVISRIPGGSGLGSYAQFDERSTADIIASVSRNDEIQNVDISMMINGADFPDFNFAKWNAADEPEIPFIEDLTNSCQAILESKIAYGSNPMAIHLGMCVIAILTNGMIQKGDFLDTFKILAEQVPGLSRIIEASHDEKPWNRIALFAIHLLNEQALIPVLRRMHFNEAWAKQYYTNTSLLASPYFETVIDILAPVLTCVKFEMSNNPDIIMKDLDHREFFPRYVQATMFSHLALHRVLKSDFTLPASDFENYLMFQMTYFLNYDLAVENLRSQGAPTVRYIGKIAESRSLPDNADWQEFCSHGKPAGAPLILSSDKGQESRLSKFIKAGIACRKIHIWFFFLCTSPHIAEKFFYPESPFRDWYRARYIIKYLAAIMQNLK